MTCMAIVLRKWAVMYFVLNSVRSSVTGKSLLSFLITCRGTWTVMASDSIVTSLLTRDSGSPCIVMGMPLKKAECRPLQVVWKGHVHQVRLGHASCLCLFGILFSPRPLTISSYMYINHFLSLSLAYILTLCTAYKGSRKIEFSVFFWTNKTNKLWQMDLDLQGVIYNPRASKTIVAYSRWRHDSRMWEGEGQLTMVSWCMTYWAFIIF